MSDDISIPNVSQQLAPSTATVTGTASPQQPPTTAATTTTANGNRPTTSSVPTWLIPGNRPLNRPNRRGAAPSSRAIPRSPSGPSSLANSEEGIGSSIDAGAAAQTQTQSDQHLRAPQHESQPLPAAHQDLIASSPSPVLGPQPSEHPVACGAKRKATVAVSCDEKRHESPLHRDGDMVKSGEGGGRKRWISEQEGTRIMMETATALKNTRRRVTTSGVEIHGHGKRAKRTAATSDDGESSPHLLSLSHPPPPALAVLTIGPDQIQTHVSHGKGRSGDYWRRVRHPEGLEGAAISVWVSQAEVHRQVRSRIT
jgi:hypothetical protein